VVRRWQTVFASGSEVVHAGWAPASMGLAWNFGGVKFVLGRIPLAGGPLGGSRALGVQGGPDRPGKGALPTRRGWQAFDFRLLRLANGQ
jgi:hypothetical protein